jgi:hypothetical protein
MEAEEKRKPSLPPRANIQTALAAMVLNAEQKADRGRAPKSWWSGSSGTSPEKVDQ